MYENDLLELADATDKPDFDDTAFFDAAGMVYIDNVSAHNGIALGCAIKDFEVYYPLSFRRTESTDRAKLKHSPTVFSTEPRPATG